MTTQPMSLKEAEAEIKRLRELVKEAFWEGFRSGKDGGWVGEGQGIPWKESDARKGLNR